MLLDVIPDYIDIEKFEVEEVFLKSEENYENKIRKRGQHGVFTYTHALRIYNKNTHEKQDIKKQITARDYNILFEQRDLSKKILKKQRKCFFWEGK